MVEQSQSQYAAAAKVPLIKSPSLWVPPPVQLPPDIHPLPEDVTAYFVYPFTLEPHILTLESSRQTTLAAHATRRDAYLHSRQEEKDRRKREALRRIAPGFEPMGGPLVPVKVEKHTPSSSISHSPFNAPLQPRLSQSKPRSAMDDLVDQLEAMEARSSSVPSSKPQSYPGSHSTSPPAAAGSSGQYTPMIASPQVHSQIPLSAPAPIATISPPVVPSPPVAPSYVVSGQGNTTVYPQRYQ